MKREQILLNIFIGMVVLCSGFLRVQGLYKFDLWFDEIGTDLYSCPIISKVASLSGQSQSSVVLSNLKNDPHSSLYYVLVYFYSLLGEDGKGLRIISTVFSMLSLGMFYKLVRISFSKPVSVYAMAFLGFSPFHLWYAQEARAYAMACFFVLAALYAYFCAEKTDRSIYWFSFVWFGVLAIYSSYYVLFLVLILGLFLIIKGNKEQFKKWLVCSLVILASLAIQYSIIGRQISFVKNAFWLSVPNLEKLIFTWKVFALGYSATYDQYNLGLGIFTAIFTYGVFASYRLDKVKTLLFLSLLFLPLLAVYVFSVTVMPIYINRQLIIFSPFYYLFLGNGISSIKNIRLRVLTLMTVFILLSVSINNYYSGFMIPNPEAFIGVIPKRNYSAFTKHIKDNYRPGDTIVVSDIQSYSILYSDLIKEEGGVLPSIPLQSVRFMAYPDHLKSYEKRFLQIEEIKDMSAEDSKKLCFFKPSYDRKLKRLSGEEKVFESQRVWMFSASWYKDGILERNPRHVRELLSSKLTKQFSKQQDGFFLDLFVQKREGI